MPDKADVGLRGLGPGWAEALQGRVALPGARDTQGHDPVNCSQCAHLRRTLENKSQRPQTWGLSEFPVHVWGGATWFSLPQSPRVSSEIVVCLCAQLPRRPPCMGVPDQASVGAPRPTLTTGEALGWLHRWRAGGSG